MLQEEPDALLYKNFVSSIFFSPLRV
jgi:hypothetical protein